MHNNEKHSAFQTLLRYINQFLPVLFWSTLILGFEEIDIALMSLASAILHEGGHILFLKLRGIKNSGVRGVVSGFRIKSEGILTYNEEIIMYLLKYIIHLMLVSVCQ